MECSQLSKFILKCLLIGINRRFPFILFLGIVIGLGVFVLLIVIPTFLDTLIVSVALSLQPVISSILVWILGMQAFPGIITMTGTMLVLPGLGLITYGQSRGDDLNKVNDTKKLNPPTKKIDLEGQKEKIGDKNCISSKAI